jgi:prepilin-type processing-associated H-X9-DG protein
MRQIAVGMNLYANDHSGRYPTAYPDEGATWRMKLLPYVGMAKDTIGINPLPVEAGVFVCPSFEKSTSNSRQASYVVNGQMRPEYRSDWAYRQSAVNPATTFLLLEYNRNTEQFLYAWGDEDVARRHPNGSANYAFVDSHVENIEAFVPRGDKRWFSSN